MRQSDPSLPPAQSLRTQTLLRQLAGAEEALQSLVSTCADAPVGSDAVLPVLRHIQDVLHQGCDQVEAWSREQSARDDLEARVQERTARLIRTNEELRYQARLIDNVSDGIIATDELRRVTTWNRAAQQMFGWTAEEVMGRSLADIIPAQYVDTDRATAYRTLAETDYWQGETIICRKDGTPVVVEGTVIALHDADGSITGYVCVNRDVTARQQAESEKEKALVELRDRETRLRLILDQLPLIVTTMDRDLRITSTMGAGLNALGARPEEVVGMRISDYLQSDDPDLPIVRAQRRALEGESASLEMEWMGRCSQVFIEPLRDANGDIAGTIGVSLDITERKRAEEALQAAHDELDQRVRARTRELAMLLEISNTINRTLEMRSLLDLILDQLKTIVEYDNAGVYLLEGQELVALTYRGVPLDLAALRFPASRSPLHRRVILDQSLVILADLWADPYEVREMREEMEPKLRLDLSIVRSWIGVPLQVQGRVIGMMSITHHEPGHYSAHDGELVLTFANQVAIAIENVQLVEQAKRFAAVEERQRLARDLHDAVSQSLFAAGILADTLPALWELDQVEALKRLKELRRLTHGALAEMRLLLLELRPEALAEVPLQHLIPQLARAMSGRSRLHIKTRVTGDCPLPPDVQATVYRIAQEALNNIIKHAEASRASLELQSSGVEGRVARVELVVSDNGRGFAPDCLSPQSMGLRMMRERAASIGAEFKVKSSPGQGTRVSLVWKGTCPDPDSPDSASAGSLAHLGGRGGVS